MQLSVDDIVNVLANPRFHNRGKFIQGFFYEPDYVIRDCWLPYNRQELFRSPNKDEYEAALVRAKARVYAEAIHSLIPATDQAEPVAKIVSAHGDPAAFGEREIRILRDISKIPYGSMLYLNPAPNEAVPRAARAQ